MQDELEAAISERNKEAANCESGALYVEQLKSTFRREIAQRERYQAPMATVSESRAACAEEAAKVVEVEVSTGSSNCQATKLQ